MQNKSGFIFISEMQPIFERSSKVRISEKKTKRILSFLEREYLRAKLKGSANRAKYQTIILDAYQLNPQIPDVLSKNFACARKQY